MAEVNSDQWPVEVPQPAYPGGGIAILLFGSIEIASALNTNDTINMFRFPNGFTPIEGYMYGDDLDSGSGVLELDVGLGTIAGSTVTVDNATYFLDSGAINGTAVTGIKPEASIWLPLGGQIRDVKPVELGANRICVVTVAVQANAGGTGTLTVAIKGLNRDPRVGL